jgi:hypothetical protein
MTNDCSAGADRLSVHLAGTRSTANNPTANHQMQ